MHMTYTVFVSPVVPILFEALKYEYYSAFIVV